MIVSVNKYKHRFDTLTQCGLSVRVSVSKYGCECHCKSQCVSYV